MGASREPRGLEAWTSPAAVARRYGEASEIREVGPSVYSYRRPAIDWLAFATDFIPWPSSATVLDAGCGPGPYLPYIAKHLARAGGGRLLGLDFTTAQLRRAREAEPSAGLIAGDVQALPLPDACVDVVLSAHMLYHVPDIRGALREFRRVLRPGGMLAIIVGTDRDQCDLDDLFLAAGGAYAYEDASRRFTADNAPEHLEGIFPRVERRVVTPELRITDVEAVVGHFRSLRSIAEPALRPGVGWDAFLTEVARLAAEAIEREGAFVVFEEIALLRCR